MYENILDINLEELLRKPAFRRAVPSVAKTGSGSSDYNANLFRNPVRYEYLTQADFLREYDINSHKINSIKYYPNRIVQDADHRYKVKVRTRVAVAWQRRIHAKRLAALTGNDCTITLASSQTGDKFQELLAVYKEGWSVKSMENAIYRAIRADGKVGDVALAFYKDEIYGEMSWRVFNYEDGDILYPHYDARTGKMDAFGRLYSICDINGRNTTYLEVWSDFQMMRYRQENADGGNQWVVEQEPALHGFASMPVAYHRYGEPFWSASQSLIEEDELAMSQLAENNSQYALRILYALGAELEMQSTVDGTPTQINSSDPNAKVGFLEPADSSKSFELQLNKTEKEIMRCSFCVETPEIKSGSDVSSLTVKMLFADSYQKALDDAKEYQPFLNDVVRIFKDGYGTEIGRTSEFNALKVQICLTPWVFMSDTEVVNSLVQLSGVGILSKKSAAEHMYEVLGYGTIDEAQRVLQQEHDALVAESTAATDNEINAARG